VQSQKIDWILALVLLPTIRQGTAVPETEAPIIRVENEKRVSKSECTPAGIKMVVKAGKSVVPRDRGPCGKSAQTWKYPEINSFDLASATKIHATLRSMAVSVAKRRLR
jgi:hypothetical protein